MEFLPLGFLSFPEFKDNTNGLETKLPLIRKDKNQDFKKGWQNRGKHFTEKKHLKVSSASYSALLNNWMYKTLGLMDNSLSIDGFIKQDTEKICFHVKCMYFYVTVNLLMEFCTKTKLI